MLREDDVRAFEQRPRFAGLVRARRHVPSPVRECGLLEWLVRQLGTLLEVPLRFSSGGKRGCSLACPRQRGAGVFLDLCRVGCIGRRNVRVEIVRRDDLDELVLTRCAFEVCSGREMLFLAVCPCKRLVGNAPEEILEEPVLAVLGGSWISLNAEDLLPYERRQNGLQVQLGETRERAHRLLREGL